MDNLTHDTTGVIHLLSALASLVFGTSVLLLRKGTALHKRVGYCYTAAMSVMLVTAFMIYRVFGGFGLFHVFAVISSVTLAAGMWPALRRRGNWVMSHLAFMYWSVIGLYAATVSEVLTRIPDAPVWWMLGFSVAIVMICAELVWRRQQSRWAQQFSIA
ncbi:MAG: DUF2306 domain-containing protein [Pseudomonadaceae bacterium]|nr:DUF2306 domain-containing protein [Pseudomonadaceae bacterium]